MTILNGRTRVASRNASFHEGVFAGVMLSPLKLVFTLGLGVIAFLLLAWVIDWVFVFKVWPQGALRLRNILADDLAHGVSLVSLQGGGVGAIVGPANFLYEVVFEVTGIDDMGRQFAERSALSIPDTIVRRAYVAHREAIETAMVATQLLGVRMAVLVRFAPLLVLLCAVGAADGLTARAIRRSCGGRESASLYHRAKYSQMAVLGLGGGALLVWPGPVWWELCAGLIVMTMGSLARGQWAYYKKHL